jgi:hypothetical protein
MAVYSTAVSPFIFTEEQTETINTGVDTPGKPYTIIFEIQPIPPTGMTDFSAVPA